MPFVRVKNFIFEERKLDGGRRTLVRRNDSKFAVTKKMKIFLRRHQKKQIDTIEQALYFLLFCYGDLFILKQSTFSHEAEKPSSLLAI